MAKKTVLIFGISSFVGSNLAEFLKKDYRIVGTYHKTSVKIDGVLTLPCDVLAKDEVQLVFYATTPDIVIYAVGLTSLLDCNEANDYADALNTVGLFNVSDNSQRYKSLVVYLSSHYVFSGEKKLYREMDTPDPNTTLGKTKASAEFYLQKNSLNYLILRVGTLYGRSVHPAQQTIFEKLERVLFSGNIFSADSNIFVGFLDIYFLGMILKLLLEREERNRLFQVSSKDIVTYAQFSKYYATIFGYGESSVSKTRWPIPLLDLPRGVDSTDVKLYFDMDIMNVETTLGIDMPTVEESLQFSFRRFNGQEHKKKRAQGSHINFI